MGGTYSYLESEKKTWIDHDLKFDSITREANLKILENIKDGVVIYLSYTASEWGGIYYQHWFVTDSTYFIEFGSASADIYNALVTINTNNKYDYSVDSKLTRNMDEDVRDRVRHVLGMSNYSLCLRNCEHVANYIYRGRWVSSQMDNGCLMKKFRSYMKGKPILLVNTFPSCIRPHKFNNEVTNKLYSFIDDHYMAIRFDYYLDFDEDTYNVLVVGPTGGGKSHLINVFFNQEICETPVSHHSVTREIYFIRGRGKVYNAYEEKYVERNIVVADTIGLCDTEWDDDKIINLIKGRICSNFKLIDAVYIVFRADRILKEYVTNIKKILKWLKYDQGINYLKFQFVGTYCEYLDNDEKNSLRKEATKIFGLKETNRSFPHTNEQFESLVYTGFPPEDSLNELTKPRVEESWQNLRMLLTTSRLINRISISENSCTVL